MSWRYIGRINQLVILEHGYYFFCLVLPLLAEPLLKSPRITQASAIQNEYPQPGTLGYVFFLFGGSGEQRGFALRSLSTRVGRRGRVAFSLYLRWNSSAARFDSGIFPIQFNSSNSPHFQSTLSSLSYFAEGRLGTINYYHCCYYHCYYHH